jgi:transcription elongation GreA/GreB family factor
VLQVFLNFAIKADAMSRAFVKEIDDAPPAAMMERPISSAPNRVTPRGARLIEEAIAALEQDIARAPEGEAAPSQLRDLRYWRARRASMQIVTPNPTPTAVGFGVQVTIRRGSLTSDITIVGEDEGDPARGLIAWTAPLARALDGAENGETVAFDRGGHSEEIAVIAIRASAS